MATTPTSDLPLPYLYSRKTDSKGRIYYENHATESTTWLHPVKLAELQTAGLVAPSTSSAPFVELSKDEDVDQKRLCPEAVVRGRDGREGAPFRKVSTGTVDGVMLPEEEEYTSRGLMPPWVVEEITVTPDGTKLVPYWVDYRTNSQNPSQSPLDIYAARQKLRALKTNKTREEHKQSQC